MYNGYVPLPTMAKVPGTVVGKWISHGMPSGIFHFAEIAYCHNCQLHNIYILNVRALIMQPVTVLVCVQ